MTGVLALGNHMVESFHTLLPDPDDPIESLLGRLEGLVSGERPGQVLEVRVFASENTFGTIGEALKHLPGSAEWPVSLLDGTPGPEGGVAGIQLHLVEGAPVDTVRVEDAVLGRVFQDEGARYCILGGVGLPVSRGDPADQATATLLRMEMALQSLGMEMDNLVRTWFFLDDILGWYGEFNRARTRIYHDRGILDGFVPASTGIGGKNHLGSALLSSALAVEPRTRDVGVRAIPSPLQCPAGSYGSSFSRAVEMTGPEWKRVLVSGTASIDSQGRTAHVGRLDEQMVLTKRVVEAILESRGLGLGDVLRGNAYFRSAHHATAYEPTLKELGLPGDRLVVSSNTVCRDDLLFELEVDAVQRTPGQRPKGTT
jgi:enamine deaminase RidA (YjgF/YER057c/UK114 family)